MQELELSATPVSLEPRNVYGIRAEVDGNIHFNLNQEVIYPVEGVIVFHDYLKKKQRFLKLPTYTAPRIICQNANRTLLGVVEQTTKEDQEMEYNIVIYDVTTFKRQHTFQPPAKVSKKRIKKISFTCESNSIVALTEYPDELLIMFQFDRLGSVYEGRAGNTNLRGTAAHMACHPTNEDIVAVCGEGLLKLLLRTEKGFTLTHDIKPDLTGTSIAWISPELLFVGTINASLILYQNGVKIKSFEAKEAELMDLFSADGTDSQEQQPQVLTKNDAVVCMTTFPKGVAYAIFNQVYVFEKVSRTRYERKTILDIPPTLYPEPLYQITNIAINPKQDTIIVSSRHSQIYVGLLIVPESLKTKRLQFKTLGERIHIDGILQVCVCAWRPIIMTISKDTTLRVWNYETGNVEIVKRFGMEINVIALYHTGQNVVVGFKDVVKVMQIYMHDFHTVKQWEYRDTKDIKVSNFGHLLAIGYEKVVVIVSAFSAETFMKSFPTDGSVSALAWARDDKSIFAADDSGAVVEFSVHTGARLQKVYDPTTKHLAISATSVPRSFYATTETGTVRLYEDSALVADVKMPVSSPLLAMSVSKSDLIMFVASQRGQLYNVHLPLKVERGGTVTATNFFDTAINQICFSYDGSLLMSCSDSGTLVIWSIKNTEGRLVPIDPDLLRSNEVLIPRKDLADMLGQISNLEMRLKQQAAEFYKKQSQNEENDQQQMADIHKGYCAALAEMQAKSNEIEERHAAELTQITSQIDELHQKHAEDMSTVATGYSERMQMEYQKFANLREEMLHIRDSYDEKLRQSKACLHDTVEALEKDFTEQLTERQELIKQLMKELDDKKQEFITYCHDTEIENDRKMINCQIEYEKKVKFESDQVDTWKTNAEGHQRKYDSILVETESLVQEVNSLKDKHLQHKTQIAQLRNDINDLHRDVADREQAISVKEKRIDEIQTKNHELEKYKHVLNHKISELKAQIEPREMQIVEKRKQIAEMEHELSGLIKNNQQLDLKLKELRDKVLSVQVELKQEKSRAKSAHLCITDISTDIYRLAGHLHSPERLKRGLKQLFLKYSDDDALKKFGTMDAQVQAKLNRQRAHIEKILDGCREKIQAKSSLGKSKKLSTERKLLQDELETIKQQNSNLQNEIVNMNILVKIFAKTKSLPDPKLQDCFVEVEQVERYFEDTMDDMQAEITAMIEENERLSEQVEMKRKLLLLSGM